MRTIIWLLESACACNLGLFCSPVIHARGRLTKAVHN